MKTEIIYHTDENSRYVIQSNYKTADSSETFFWGYSRKESLLYGMSKYDIGAWNVKLKQKPNAE